MAENAKIHFGWFVASFRDRKSWSQETMAKMIQAAGGKISSRRISGWENMPEPRLQPDNYAALARVCGFDDPEAFTQAWRSTPVHPPADEPGLVRVQIEEVIAKALLREASRKDESFRDVANRLIAEGLGVVWTGGKQPRQAAKDQQR